MIIILPVLVIQLVAVYIFYQRHWYNVTQHTSRLLISEVIDLVESEKYIHNEFIDSNHLNLKYKFMPEFEIPQKPQNHLKELDIFEKNLSKKLSLDIKKVSIHNIDNYIFLYIKLREGLLQIELPYKALYNPTTIVFVVWMIVLTFILLTVSIIFSKNQIKSIIELTNAAESYGIDSKFGYYKPSGATEIRQAGIALLKMQDRIKKQANKRAQMLAMISHDLKTPLTRMKLQVELMEEGDEKEELSHDIESMQQMVASYLDFARGEGGEQFVSIDLIAWTHDFIQKKYPNHDISFNANQEQIFIKLKSNAFERAISNLISNSLKYSTKIIISLYTIDTNAIITVEDNGNGIDEEERSLVFKPFYRADKSRCLQSPSVGLGLAITKEIIKGHYGTISLEDSVKLKGLLVRIILPIIK